MALTPTKGAEPIPGYQLVEKLGSGGFGEVWKTTAPGELRKAIKIIFGNLEEQRAEQELKALQRIKEVRHPFLLSLERYEVHDGQLFIVTELADRSLTDCYSEYRAAGLPGIPRDELLGYLRDAAEALDYMQETRGLQHLDVKPQNLLLVAGRVKVADFGLVKDLSGGTASSSSGITPVYATPEAFDGRASRFSDQYSLAIVYQEMLTGTRPFPGTTTIQLAAQHLTGRPLLNALPPHDRPIIARALSKVPEQRFGSCCELIGELQRAPAAFQHSREAPTRETRRPSLLAPAAPPKPVPIARPPASEGVTAASTIIREKSTPPEGTPPAGPPTPPVSDTIAVPALPARTASIRPTLYLGIGGLAGQTLRRLKSRLTRCHGDLTAVPFLQMLLLDVDRAAIRRAVTGAVDEALMPGEVLHVPLHPPDHYREQSRQLLRWIDRRRLYGIPRSRCTGGVRALGRLALVDNLELVLTRLKTVLATLTGPEAGAAAVERGTPFRDATPRIFVVASIGGGAGGGMVLETAYAIRQVMAALDIPGDGLCGLLLHAPGLRPAEREMSALNAHATLRELQYYSRPEITYPGDADHGLHPCGPGRPPFEECYLIERTDPRRPEEAEWLPDIVAEYLALDASPDGGAALDAFRRRTQAASEPKPSSLHLRTFGLQRIGTARDYLADRAAALLCRQAVMRWTASGSEEGRQAIEQEAEGCTGTLGLNGDALVSRLRDQVIAARGDDLVARLTWALQDDAEESALRRPGKTETSEQALARVEYVLGKERPAPRDHEPDKLTLAAALRMHAEALEANLTQAAADWLRALVETPGKRLWAGDTGVECLARSTRTAATLVNARHTKVEAQRAQLLYVLTAPAPRRKSQGWLRGKQAKDPAEQQSERLLEYYQLSLEELVLERSRAVLANLGRAVASMRHSLTSCRERVRDLARCIAGSVRLPANEEPQSYPGLTMLMPGKVASVAEAEMKLMQTLGLEQMSHFDEIVQQRVLDPRGGLWAAACGEGVVVEGGRDALADRLREAITAEARQVVQGLLKESDAASLLLERFGDREAAWQALTAHIEAALVPPPVGEWPRQLLLGLPATAAGDALRALAELTWTETPLTSLRSANDVVICHEVAGLPLAEAAAALLTGEPGGAALAVKVWSRIDIDWTGVTNPVGG